MILRRASVGQLFLVFLYTFSLVRGGVGGIGGKICVDSSRGTFLTGRRLLAGFSNLPAATPHPWHLALGNLVVFFLPLIDGSAIAVPLYVP